jgi:folylpolyglutamate synthase/dihydropteroate synthase
MWGKEGAIAIDSPADAIRYAKTQAKAEDIIFVGGSNYLVGEAIKILSEKI